MICLTGMAKMNIALCHVATFGKRLRSRLHRTGMLRLRAKERSIQTEIAETRDDHADFVEKTPAADLERLKE